jgi:hypothetical protein
LCSLEQSFNMQTVVIIQPARSEARGAI